VATGSDVESGSWGRLIDHVGLGVLSARFHRDLLEEVINDTGCREKRSRRLPAHVMIRYVIAMGLFFDESYEEVMRRVHSRVELACGYALCDRSGSGLAERLIWSVGGDRP